MASLAYMTGAAINSTMRGYSTCHLGIQAEMNEKTSPHERFMRSLVDYNQKDPLPDREKRLIKNRERKHLIFVKYSFFLNFVIPLARRCLYEIISSTEEVVIDQRPALVRLLLSERLFGMFKATVQKSMGEQWREGYRESLRDSFAKLVLALHTSLCSDIRWIMTRRFRLEKEKRRMARKKGRKSKEIGKNQALSDHLKAQC